MSTYSIYSRTFREKERDRRDEARKNSFGAPPTRKRCVEETTRRVENKKKTLEN